MDDKTLRKLQLTELDILIEIDKICKENNIQYFLIGGTLLGAVRHKGFIPWDDDIDVGMIRSDYEKFIDLCLNKNVLGEKYFLHCNESDENYFIPFVKVKKNNTTFAEENIDALAKGIVNLDKHIENMQNFGINVVVTLNAFATDTEAEHNFIKEHVEAMGCEFALADVWAKGGEGGLVLADKVLKAIDKEKQEFTLTYTDDLGL